MGGCLIRAADPGGGRKRAVVVRKRARLEPRRCLSRMASKRAFATRSSASPIFGDLDGFVSTQRRNFNIAALKRQIGDAARQERPISDAMSSRSSTRRASRESNALLMDVRNRPRAFAERLANLRQQPWLSIAADFSPHGASGGRAIRSFRAPRGRSAELPEGAWFKWRFAGARLATPLWEPSQRRLRSPRQTADMIAIVPLRA